MESISDVIGTFCEKETFILNLLSTEALFTVGEDMFVNWTGGELDYLESFPAIQMERLAA